VLVGKLSRSDDIQMLLVFFLFCQERRFSCFVCESVREYQGLIWNSVDISVDVLFLIAAEVVHVM